MTERLVKALAARLGFTPKRVAEALMQAMNANRPPADVANEVLASFPSFRAQLQSTAGADDFWDFMMQDQETRESISPLVRPQLKRYLRAIAASVQQTAN